METTKTQKAMTKSQRARKYIRNILSVMFLGYVTYQALIVVYPQPFIALPVALVVAVVVFLLMERYDLTVLIFASIGLASGGLGVLISSNWRPDVAGLGIGLVSLGFGGLAIIISIKSDKRLSAIADMQFYEKMAIIQTYLKAANPADSDKYDASRIFYDLKAAKQLENWVSSREIVKMLNDEIEALTGKTLSGQKYEHLIKRLQQIKQGDC